MHSTVTEPRRQGFQFRKEFSELLETLCYKKLEGLTDRYPIRVSTLSVSCANSWFAAPSHTADAILDFSMPMSLKIFSKPFLCSFFVPVNGVNLSVSYESRYQIYIYIFVHKISIMKLQTSLFSIAMTFCCQTLCY